MGRDKTRKLAGRTHLPRPLAALGRFLLSSVLMLPAVVATATGCGGGDSSDEGDGCATDSPANGCPCWDPNCLPVSTTTGGTSDTSATTTEGDTSAATTEGDATGGSTEGDATAATTEGDTTGGSTETGTGGSTGSTG